MRLPGNRSSVARSSRRASPWKTPSGFAQTQAKHDESSKPRPDASPHRPDDAEALVRERAVAAHLTHVHEVEEVAGVLGAPPRAAAPGRELLGWPAEPVEAVVRAVLEDVPDHVVKPPRVRR